MSNYSSEMQLDIIGSGEYHGGLGTGPIIGIIVVIVILLVATGGAAFYFYKKNKKENDDTSNSISARTVSAAKNAEAEASARAVAAAKNAEAARLIAAARNAEAARLIAAARNAEAAAAAARNAEAAAAAAASAAINAGIGNIVINTGIQNNKILMPLPNAEDQEKFMLYSRMLINNFAVNMDCYDNIDEAFDRAVGNSITLSSSNFKGGSNVTFDINSGIILGWSSPDGMEFNNYNGAQTDVVLDFVLYNENYTYRSRDFTSEGLISVERHTDNTVFTWNMFKQLYKLLLTTNTDEKLDEQCYTLMQNQMSVW